MLVIRKLQMEALSEARRVQFEARMVTHHEQHFPAWSLAQGPAALTAFVRHGMSRAWLHGIRTELDTARYLHVMQVLGTRFDESPEYPWAAEMLGRDLPATEKMDCLRDAVDCQIEARRIRDGSGR
jgi:hypothetical protein